MAFDANDPADVELLNKKIEEATTGLKSKNTELIGDLKKVKKEQEEFRAKYEGIDPDKVRNLLSKFENDEEAKLIADGNFDKLVEIRTERMRKNYDKLLAEKDGNIQKLQTFTVKAKAGILSAAVKDAAAKAGVLPEALDDVLLRANILFKVDEDGNLSAVKGDEVILGKDGKTPLQPGEWVESLREVAPHFWPRASGTGAGGGSGGKAAKKFSEMDEKERTELYRTNRPEYERLRDADKAAAKK